MPCWRAAQQPAHVVIWPPPAVAGEAAGLSLGLLCAGSGTEKAAELLAYAHETQASERLEALAWPPADEACSHPACCGVADAACRPALAPASSAADRPPALHPQC